VSSLEFANTTRLPRKGINMSRFTTTRSCISHLHSHFMVAPSPSLRPVRFAPPPRPPCWCLFYIFRRSNTCSMFCFLHSLTICTQNLEYEFHATCRRLRRPCRSKHFLPLGSAHLRFHFDRDQPLSEGTVLYRGQHVRDLLCAWQTYY
jgi:hypothetical protein